MYDTLALLLNLM